MIKNLKYFIFIFIIFLNFNVFASNTNVSNKIKYSTSSSGGTYKGDEIYLGGYNDLFSINTRYNGRLGMLSFYISTSDYNFSTNHSYTITLNMATDDWRNNFMGPQVANAQSNGSLGSSLSVSNFRFVSMKQVKFNFKTSGTLNPYIYFRLYSIDYANPNGNNTAITGVNNWNLSSVYINDNVSSTPSPAPVPTSTPSSNNQQIIDNNNKNTQDIIDNSNENTTDIIDNANENTENIINNQNNNTKEITNSIDNVSNQLGTCYTNYFDFDKLGGVSSGNINITRNGNTLNAHDYTGWNSFYYDIPIPKPGTYTFSVGEDISNSTYVNVYYYDMFFNRGDYLGGIVNSGKSFTFSTDRNKGYFRVYFGDTYDGDYSFYFWQPMITNTNSAMEWTPYGETKCTSKLDSANSIAQDTNNYLKDNSDPNIADSELSGVLGSVGYTDPLSYLLQLPTLLINQLVAQSDTCQVVNLGQLWGVSLTLPCIDIGSYIGESVWNTIDILFAIGLLVNIFKNLYHTFANLLTLGAEKEAREKFNFPTPMDFLSMILGGGR